MTYSFSFESYDPKDCYPPQEVEWDLPLLVQAYKDSIIRQAGFDPADNPRIGVTMQWGKHMTRCIVAAPCINFIHGRRFAVSTEPV